MDTAHDLLGRKGFDDVVVDSQFEAEELVVFLAPRRKHDDGNILALLDLLDRGKAVKLGHHDIHEDEVEVFALAQADGFHAVLRLAHLEAFEFGILLQHFADLDFVVDNEYLAHNFFSRIE